MEKKHKVNKKSQFMGLVVVSVFLVSFIAIMSIMNVAIPVIAIGEGDEVLNMRLDSLDHDDYFMDLSEYENHGDNHDGEIYSGATDVGDANNAVYVSWYDYGSHVSPNWIALGDNSSLNLDDTDFTVAFWIKFAGYDDGASQMCVFQSAGDDWGNDDYQMVFVGLTEVSSVHRVKLAFYGVAGITTSLSVSLTTWTHIVVIYDESVRLAKFYKNGVYVESKTLGANPNFGSFSGAQLGRAWNGEYAGAYWEGRLDEVHIYKDILDNTEVDDLYDYAMVSTTDISDAKDGIMQYLDRMYQNYTVDSETYAFLGSYPAAPIAVKYASAGDHQVTTRMTTPLFQQDYITIEKDDTIDEYQQEKFNITLDFQYNSRWVKMGMWLWWYPDGRQFTRIYYYGGNLNTNDGILIVWLFNEEVWNKDVSDFEIGDFETYIFGTANDEDDRGSTRAYRYCVRHESILGYRIYEEEARCDESNALLESVEFQGYDIDDIYDCLFEAPPFINYHWTTTDDFNRDALYHDVDLWEDWEDNPANLTLYQSAYPWDIDIDGDNHGGYYPYKSSVAISRSLYKAGFGQDSLYYALKSAHYWDRYGTTAHEDAIDLLELCDYDGKGIGGMLSDCYSTVRLCAYIVAASRWASAGYWSWEEVDQSVEILLQLQWSLEDRAYDSDEEEFVLYLRPNHEGGFVTGYDYGSAVGFKGYRSNFLDYMEKLAAYLFSEVVQDSEYDGGLTPTNTETTCMAYIALMTYYELRLDV